MSESKVCCKIKFCFKSVMFVLFLHLHTPFLGHKLGEREGMGKTCLICRTKKRKKNVNEQKGRVESKRLCYNFHGNREGIFSFQDTYLDSIL